MKDLHIILVEPIYKGNVGSVARIMHNFECYNLRIVGELPVKEDFVMGAHSEEILSRAEIFDSLADAIADCDRVIALSRRVGNKKEIDLYPWQLSEYITPITKVALVFGRETFGLTDEEADLCDLRCHIPANPAFPSLNLAQAVAVVLYEVYKSSLLPVASDLCPVAPKAAITDSVSFAVETLDSINIFRDERDKKGIEDFLHSLMYRSNATRQMTIELKKVFNRIHLAFHNRGKGY